MLTKFLDFEPQGWDLGLKAGIWASRLGSEERDGGEGENSPYDVKSARKK